MKFPVIAAKVMLEGFHALGLDTELIRESAGIDAKALADVTGHLPGTSFGQMWACAFEVVGRDSLAVEVAQNLPLGSVGILDYLFASANSVGAALDVVSQYFGLVTEQISLEIERTLGRLWIRVRNDAKLDAYEVSDELALSWTLRRLHEFAVVPPKLIEMSLTRKSVTDVANWERLLGTKIRFGSLVSGICFTADAADIPLKTADPRLQLILRGVLPEFSGSTPSQLLVVRAAVRNLLRKAQLSEANLARELSLSVRSLQRRLQESGSSYRTLVEDARHEEAIRMLSSTEYSLAEIAHALGFREHASFTKAFRRWTGLSPSAWLQERARLAPQSH
ncbi:AraC family transcriptional regulator [Pendulispora brunnea]|uniref:AraC family transcriptional regulator n=1 Tax=Pendulispora brunnea TaxID=2905690 RepID=A0ABZ2K124_9BACT